MDIMPLFAQHLKPQTNVWDAISDLPEIEPGNGDGLFNYQTNSKSDYQKILRTGSDHIENHICSKLGKINLERLKHIPQGGSWRDIPFDLLPEGLKRACRSDHTKRYGRLRHGPRRFCPAPCLLGAGRPCQHGRRLLRNNTRPHQENQGGGQWHRTAQAS